jgi:uncharacterized protein (TIGR00159 family)
MPHLTIKDIIDILLFATILYSTFRVLHRSGAVNLFWGIFAFLLVWFTTRFVFHLELTGALFDRVISVGAIALIVIFQNEIRSFFYNIGFHIGNLSRHFHRATTDERTATVEKVVSAACNMSRKKTGALIVFEGRQDLTEYADTGERLDAAVSVRLIEHIFFKNTPLHDGALIIRNDRLLSTACVMPLAPDRDLPKQYGLRHRAALGIAEQTDAIALVVSEETGEISVAHGDVIEAVKQEELTYKIDLLWNGASSRQKKE